MSIKNLIRREKETAPVRRTGSDVFGLRRDIDHLFDEFFTGFGVTPFRGWDRDVAVFAPRVDIVETDREVQLSAELPGLEEKDFEVTVDDDAVTIKGEKKEEHEEKTEQSYHLERSYGSFHRVIPLPAEIEAGKASATFKKGVLKVVLPKAATEKAKGRRIEIKAE